MISFSLCVTSPALKTPSLATKYYPEFQGRQVSIKQMLVAGRPNPITAAAKRDLSPLSQEAAKGPLQKATNNKIKKAKSEASAAKITQFFVPKTTGTITTTVLDPEKTLQAAEVDSFRSEFEDFSNVEATENFVSTTLVKNETSRAAWGALFRPPPPAPLCPGHGEAAVKRRVNKKGPNLGRAFFACRRGEGRSDDPAARCDFFKWAK